MKPPTNARHSFAIKVLGKMPGLFKPQRYTYYCVRCRWSFLVNDGKRGVITALDDAGDRLAGIEAAEHIATFAIGPCPALRILSLAISRPHPSISTNSDSHVATPIPLEQHRRREHRSVNSHLS